MNNIFSDIQNHWAKDGILKLAERELVKGYPDRTFRPDAPITRAEFATLMCGVFPEAERVKNAVDFVDVPGSHWAIASIQTASEKGFFAGYPDRTFKPEQKIPRVQAIVVLAAHLKADIPENPDSILQQFYDDFNDIPAYAKSPVAAATLAALVVNYPQLRQLNPNRNATRGEVATLLCRALNYPVIPGRYIVGFDVIPMELRPLTGGLNNTPTFNSNSPELVKTEGILLSTFPPAGKRVGSAHLDFAFEGQFDIFSHHIYRAETEAELQSCYQGILLHNPTAEAVTVRVSAAASYLGTPDAPFIDLPEQKDNSDGDIYSGPGSRTTGAILRGERMEQFPAEFIIESGKNYLLMNEAIPLPGVPASNGRSTLIRLETRGKIYIADLIKLGDSQPPNLADWNALLETGDLAEPRDATPTPLEPEIVLPIVFSRVAGVSRGTRWEATLTDKPEFQDLSLPPVGKAFSYVLGTIHKITLGTGQIQSAKMLSRYPDTAYFAHANYGVEYDITIPFYNSLSETHTVEISVSSPVKNNEIDGVQTELKFLKNRDRIFFRGPVRLSYEDEGGNTRTRDIHLTQYRGQQGSPLLSWEMPPLSRRRIRLQFIYPPDSTPPQVLTVRTVR